MRPCTFILACLLALTAAGLQSAVRAEPLPATRSIPLVAIQPLGCVDIALVRAAARHVAETFATRVIVLEQLPLPASAYTAPRRRYRGSKVLCRLEETTPARVTKVVGLMSRDLSDTHGAIPDWGIIGIAELGKRAAVVSTYRLRRGSRALIERRMLRIVEHELAHAFGLPHCPTPGCLMHDAEGSIRTVDRGTGCFCPACRRRLGSVLSGAPGPSVGRAG